MKYLNKDLVATILVILLTIFSVSAVFSPEGKLVNKLLQNYTKMARPVLDPQETVKINISMVMKSLIQIDEKKQFMQISYYLLLSWKDQYLTWSNVDNDGKCVSKLKFPIN